MEGDVRGFYAALGIELPGWVGGANVSVRCFADPGAHQHEDRTPSCSVSTEHGAWMCWSCGAKGGAYDAALALGLAPGEAMELLREYGLVEGREGGFEGGAGKRGSAVREPAAPRPGKGSRQLEVTDADVRRWHKALFSEERRRWRELIAARRLWSEGTMRELELGYDGARITIPIRGGGGRLRGVLRYRPGAQPKMLAVPGTRLGLIPHPSGEASGRILLVEGVPDMLAARSRGWPALAVPGDRAWRAEWAELFRLANVTIAMDCDAPGREAAQRISHDLRGVGLVRVVDLAPARSDGFDLTDWLAQRGRTGSQSIQGSTGCTPSSSSKLPITR